MAGARATAWNGGGGGGDKGGGRRALTLALVMGALALQLAQPAEGRSLRSNKKHKNADADPAPRDQQQGKCLGMGTCVCLLPVYVMPRSGTCRGRAVGDEGA